MPQRRDPLSLLRGVWGVTLLLEPGRVLAALGGDDSPPVRVVARVLGARHVAEAAVVTVAGDAVPPRWTLAVDGLHAASMLVLAAASTRYRRDALFSAGVTGTFVALSEWERRRA